MNDLGKGIAVAGIWIGVGIAAFSAGDHAGPIAMCAMAATFAVALFWDV